MPYICLARSDIPDGVVQVLDLLPNSSLRIPSLSPLGETRYVNRVKRDPALILASGLLSASVDGLDAYLVDRIEPGGLEQAAGSITVLAGLAATETFTINGVVFTAVNGVPNPAVQEFRDIAGSGGIAATVATIVTAINDAASVAAMKLGTITGSYAFATDASPAITMVARKGAGVALTGWQGNMTLAMSALAHMTLSGARFTRTTETWTSAVQIATAAALVARLDAGLALALADINTVLLAQAGADLTGVTSDSRSNGTVVDILACLAGRTFRAPRMDTTGRAAAADVDANSSYRYMDATYPTFKWHDTVGRGGFTQFVLNNGDVMQNGEIKPLVIGGDTENREVAGIRHTYNVDALTASLVVGQLSRMVDSTLLWPTTNIFPHFPFGQAGFTEFDPITAPRLVVVYDDTGAVM
jgi:hypothetical protein